MTINIDEIIIHRIKVNALGELELTSRESTIDINETSIELAKSAITSFRKKPGKGVATFKKEAELAQPIKQLASNNNNFLEVSSIILERLKDGLDSHAVNNAECLILIKGEWLNSHNLLALCVNLSNAVSLDESNLDVRTQTLIDPTSLLAAFKIDLELVSEDPYKTGALQFYKNRQKKKITELQLDWLQAFEETDAKSQTKTLTKAVEAYLDKEKLSPEDKASARKKVQKLCTSEETNGEVNIKDIAEAFEDQTMNGSFDQFVKEHDYDINNSVVTDSAEINAMGKYKGQANGLTINFDKKLLGKGVSYNSDSGTITISTELVPEGLKAQLIQTLKSE